MMKFLTNLDFLNNEQGYTSSEKEQKPPKKHIK